MGLRLRLAIKIIWGELGGWGFLLLLILPLFLGFGPSVGFFLRGGLIAGLVFLLLFYQLWKDNRFTIRQAAYLPDYPQFLKRLLLLFAIIYPVYFLFLNQLAYQQLNWDVLAASFMLTALIFFGTSTIVFRSAFMIVGFLLALIFIFVPELYWGAAPFLSAMLIYALFFNTGWQLRSPGGSRSPQNTSRQPAITRDNYVLRFILLSSKRQEHLRGNLKFFLAMPVILSAYLLYAIRNNGNFDPFYYGIYLQVILFAGLLLYGLILLNKLRPTIDFTGRLKDVEKQLAPFLYGGFYGLAAIMLVAGSWYVNGIDPLMLTANLLGTILFWLTVVPLLVHSRKYYFHFSLVIFIAIILMLLKPGFQLLFISIAFLIRQFYTFTRKSTNSERTTPKGQANNEHAKNQPA